MNTENLRDRVAQLLTTAPYPGKRAYDKADAVLAAVLPEHEKQVREQVAQDLLAVEMVEWALAGQHAGFEAAKIAREGRAALDAPGGGQPAEQDPPANPPVPFNPHWPPLRGDQ